jgi:hypothetical protein
MFSVCANLVLSRTYLRRKDTMLSGTSVLAAVSVVATRKEAMSARTMSDLSFCWFSNCIVLRFLQDMVCPVREIYGVADRPSTPVNESHMSTLLFCVTWCCIYSVRRMLKTQNRKGESMVEPRPATTKQGATRCRKPTPRRKKHPQ